MEQNLPVVAKKFWKIVRVALCMLRKGVSKQKLMLDIKLMMKRSKISSYKSAVQNLMFHFNLIHNRRSQNDSNLPFSPREDEYEFSCSSTPNLNKHTEEDVTMMNAAVMKALEMIKAERASKKEVECKKHSASAESEEWQKPKGFNVDSLPSSPNNYLQEMIKAETESKSAAQCTKQYPVLAVSKEGPHPKRCDADSLRSSPDNYLRGFGKQVRVTDSPFPVRNEVEALENHVDEAADEFISKFYRNLRRQSSFSTA
ncbi:uncharacterized protein LOC132039595 [Lycium ferocissimum]|uniref:uncharacterized protein LOC132039595 n=1 Tax=Lycium ferocissimum TaxID=112874 RepID=UPI00281679C7|nr:uncharacterized protein LOC132039595 [Lycium ferocissimum]